MFRPIRMDHTNCLQVAIKSIQFLNDLWRDGAYKPSITLPFTRYKPSIASPVRHLEQTPRSGPPLFQSKAMHPNFSVTVSVGISPQASRNSAAYQIYGVQGEGTEFVELGSFGRNLEGFLNTGARKRITSRQSSS
jgi:hypothetical protein